MVAAWDFVASVALRTSPVDGIQDSQPLPRRPEGLQQIHLKVLPAERFWHPKSRWFFFRRPPSLVFLSDGRASEARPGFANQADKTRRRHQLIPRSGVIHRWLVAHSVRILCRGLPSSTRASNTVYTVYPLHCVPDSTSETCSSEDSCLELSRLFLPDAASVFLVSGNGAGS